MRFLNFLPIFIASTISFDMKCTYFNYGWAYLPNIDYCEAHSLTITSPNQIITSVNGSVTPTTFHGLNFQNMAVLYLPKGIGKFFPQLKSLRIFSCGLKSVKAADLEGLANLQSFIIHKNPIEELGSDLFKFTPKVDDVYIVDTEISRVGKDLFSKFKSMKRIDFIGNKCISQASTLKFWNIINDIRSKCPNHKDSYCLKDFEAYEDEIKKLQSIMAKEISRLKAENERLKQTWYNGLLDSSTQLLYKESKKFQECRAGKLEEKTETVANVVLKVLSAVNSTNFVQMIVEFQESKISKIVNSSDNEVPPNQTEVVIDQQNVLFLPTNLGRFLSSLQRLSVMFSGLYKLDTRSFKGLQELLALNLTGNKLVEISEKDLIELTRLKELDLSHNNLKIIHEKAFATNVELETLKLNNNHLTAITSPILKQQINLHSLYLNDNKLKFINAALVSSSNSVVLVDLRNNDCINLSVPNATLKEIENKILDNCIKPVELKCNNDIQKDETIDDISSGVISDDTKCRAVSLTLIYPGTALLMKATFESEKIQALSIVDQKTFFIPSKLFETLPKLVQLVVERSQLETLTKLDFKSLTALEDIRIEGNNISFIEEGVFDEVPQLIHLNLASNHIESLPPKAFSMLTNLKTLILSDNKLVKFTTSLVPLKNSIKSFQLQKNNMEFIESKLLRLLRTAELIDLTDNTCIDMKYKKSEDTSDTAGTSLRDMLGHIELECSDLEDLARKSVKTTSD